MVTSRGLNTRSALIETAYELIVTKGYHATSMRMIAKEAGIAVGGIYNHFSDKDAIFEAIVQTKHPLAVILPLLKQVEGETAEALLREAALRLAQIYENQPGLMSLLFIELVEFEGRHMAGLMAELAPQLETFTGRVIAARGKVRPVSSIVLFRSLMSAAAGYHLSGRLLTGTALEEAGLGHLDDYVDIYLYGVLKK